MHVRGGGRRNGLHSPDLYLPVLTHAHVLQGLVPPVQQRDVEVEHVFVSREVFLLGVLPLVHVLLELLERVFARVQSIGRDQPNLLESLEEVALPRLLVHHLLLVVSHFVDAHSAAVFQSYQVGAGLFG